MRRNWSGYSSQLRRVYKEDEAISDKLVVMVRGHPLPGIQLAKAMSVFWT